MYIITKRYIITSVVVQPPDVDDALLLLALEHGDVVQDLLGQRATRRIPESERTF